MELETFLMELAQFKNLDNERVSLKGTKLRNVVYNDKGLLVVSPALMDYQWDVVIIGCFDNWLF